MSFKRSIPSAAVAFTFIDVDDPTNIATASLKGEAIPFIKPGSQNNVTSLEIPVDLLEGQYMVTAKFYYKNEMIGEFVSAQSFFVYPKGTLLQSGELVAVSVDKTSYVLGEKIRLNAIFKNLGSLPIVGVLNTDINLGSDFVDMIRGEELSVGVNKEVVFLEMIELDKPGNYTLSSYVKYGNKKTDAQTVDFSVVAPENKFLSFLNSKLGLAGLILLIIMAVILYKVFRAKKQLRKKKNLKFKKPPVDK